MKEERFSWGKHLMEDFYFTDLDVCAEKRGSLKNFRVSFVYIFFQASSGIRKDQHKG